MASTRNNIRRLFTRQGLLLILTAAVLLEAVSLIQYLYSLRALREEAARRAQSELTITRLEIEKKTNSVETTIHTMVWVVEEVLDRPDSLHLLLRNLLDSNEFISDVAIAFTEGYYPDKGKWFEPLLARRPDGSYEEMVLGSDSHDYLATEWFTAPLESGTGNWSEPYFDESGGKTQVITYSEPLRDTSGTIVGVLACDLTLEWFTELIDRIQVYPNSYSTLESREGHMIICPAETLHVTDPVRFSMPFEDTGWKMSIVIPEEEIYGNIKQVGLVVTILQLLGLALLALILYRTAKGQMRLEESEAKKNRIESELHIANGIQMAMLPKIFPPFPERNDLDLYASILPAKEVGGDLFDFFIRDEKLYFCIGDVSGKGIPASLVMAVTRSLFRTVASRETSPQHIVEAINRSMSEINENNMFVTFFCGVLNLETGHLRYCNAGHNAPMILTDRIQPLPVVPNLPMGVLENMVYQEQETDMAWDDALFLFTDGLTEAENRSHELFGEERMRKVLSGRRSSKAHLEDMQKAVAAFADGAPQSDDLTMLFIHFLNQDAAPASERHLILRNDIREVSRLFPFLKEFTEGKNVDADLSFNLNLALEEAVVNVLMYAYPEGVSGIVDIGAYYKEGTLTFTIADSGAPFDPTKAPDPDLTLEIGDRPVGGLGIYLVKSLMDSVQYSRADGKNVLTMTKTI